MTLPTQEFVCRICGFRFERRFPFCTNCRTENSLRPTTGEAPIPAASGSSTPADQVPIVRPEAGLAEAERRPNSPAIVRSTAAVPRDRTIHVGEEGHRSVRVSTGVAEWDRFFGGGIVAGTVIILYGAPGAGKSSWAIQVGAALEGQDVGRVLLVATEEQVYEVNERAIRLGVGEREGFVIHQASEYSSMLQAVRSHDPAVIVLDSAQALRCDDLDKGQAGSTTHLKELGLRLVGLAKNEDRPRIVIALVHVTKYGEIAGPMFLPHIGDVVAEMIQEPGHDFRRLRLDKNRYGPTSETLILEMTSTGLKTVSTNAFIAERTDAPGSVVFPSTEGSRTMFLLMQGMVGPLREGGNARRIVVGVDQARVNIVAAVLDAYTMYKLDSRDMVIQVAGGASTQDTAGDLPVAMSLLSSMMRTPVPADVVACGEIGLGGELRAVARTEDRLREAMQLGFRRAIVPRSRRPADIEGIEMIAIGGVVDLCAWMEKERDRYLQEREKENVLAMVRRERTAADGPQASADHGAALGSGGARS